MGSGVVRAAVNSLAVLRQVQTTDPPSAHLGSGVPAVALSSSQLSAIRAAMALFVDDDLARGVSPLTVLYCQACQQGRPMPGFILYGERFQFCNRCATEYEVARLRSIVASPGQFVRDKAFGEADRYALPDDG